MTATIHETDSFTLVVDVHRQADNSPLDLTDAIIVAFAEGEGGTPIAGVCAIVNAGLGQLRVTYPPATFAEGIYCLQVRVTDADGEVQTVLDDYAIQVRRSI